MASYFLFSVLKLMGYILIWGTRALIYLLNRSVAGLGSLVHTDIDSICNKARLISLLWKLCDFISDLKCQQGKKMFASDALTR